MTQPPVDDRILRFFPVENPSPRKLTPAQIRQYNEQGYIKGLPVFSPQEIAGIRAKFDALLDSILAANDGRDAYAINGYHTQCASIWDIATEPRILDYVQDILGPNFVAWGTHFFCKMPGDQRRVPWHQDASYWPLSPSKTTTVWLAIDDSDVENGAMRVVPTTHLQGHLAFEIAKPGEKVVLDQKVIDPERFGAPVSFEMKAGEMSLHADMLVHGSEPNLSNRRRCGLTIRYATVDVRSSAAWNTGSILCRGNDPE
jgi:non-heme Fe2+,alpha-ketoglutarate-dependent halogenase